jgi:hypothetical protein
MKVSTILIALIITTLYSCSPKSKTTDISGIYVTQFKNEYSITSDTLVVASEANSQTYSIERRTGFNKIRDGKTLPKEFKVAKWMSSYDIEKQMLQETELGKQISVLSEKQSLKLGDSEYQKVK